MKFQKSAILAQQLAGFRSQVALELERLALIGERKISTLE